MSQRAAGVYAARGDEMEVPPVQVAPAGQAVHLSPVDRRLYFPSGQTVHTPSICSRPAPQRHLAAPSASPAPSAPASAPRLWQTAPAMLEASPATSTVTSWMSKCR